MKIYTKKGDLGETSLIGGKRVKKNHLRIEAYGTVDELNSFIGLIRDSSEEQEQENFLITIQNRLFTVGSALASADGSKMNIPQLEEQDITQLEEAMDKMDAELEALKNFILPGGDLTASFCHTARTVCRRAERWVVALSEQAAIDPRIITYLNRLSDYLFILARFYTKRHGGKETLWNTRG